MLTEDQITSALAGHRPETDVSFGPASSRVRCTCAPRGSSYNDLGYRQHLAKVLIEVEEAQLPLSGTYRISGEWIEEYAALPDGPEWVRRVKVAGAVRLAQYVVDNEIDKLVAGLAYDGIRERTGG